MSVMNGFRGEYDKIVGVNGHAVVYLNNKNIDIIL